MLIGLDGWIKCQVQENIICPSKPWRGLSGVHFCLRSMRCLLYNRCMPNSSKDTWLPQSMFSAIRYHFSSVQSLSRVQLYATPRIIASQASLSITNSQSLLKLMSIKLVMPSSHLILCHPLLLLPPIPPNIRVFSNESTLRMRWPKYWSFSFSISPSNEHLGLISFRMDWLDLLAVQGTLKTLLQHHSSKTSFFWQFSSQSNSHIHTWPLEKPQPSLDGPLLTK